MYIYANSRSSVNKIWVNRNLDFPEIYSSIQILNFKFINLCVFCKYMAIESIDEKLTNYRRRQMSDE